MKPESEKVHRMSVSLPEQTFLALDRMVADKGFMSRSQAIAEMVTASLMEHYGETGDRVMTGTITLFYNVGQARLLKELSDLQRKYIDEVISSLRVLLEDNYTMEVVVMQGPADTLKEIANAFITTRGVKSGRLSLTTSIIPPVHARKEV